MISRCVDCGTRTGLVDAEDFYFRCADHIHELLADVADNDIPLSPKELQVALFIADGYTNQEIALELSTTQGYIRNVASRVLARLDLDRRGQVNRTLRRRWKL